MKTIAALTLLFSLTSCGTILKTIQNTPERKQQRLDDAYLLQLEYPDIKSTYDIFVMDDEITPHELKTLQRLARDTQR
jgi:hypothetical protein